VKLGCAADERLYDGEEGKGLVEEDNDRGNEPGEGRESVVVDV
jgi:hypothetical protein